MLVKLLNYWNIPIGGKISQGKLTFENKVGKGWIDTHVLTPKSQLIRINCTLKKSISGKPYLLEDEDEYLSVIFGDASCIFFDGVISANLDGAILSNEKEGVQWAIPSKKKVELILLRIHYSYFNELVNRSDYLKSIFSNGDKFTIYEEMSMDMKGVFYRLLDIKSVFFQKELLFGCTFYLFHLLIEKISERDNGKEDNLPINFRGVTRARKLIQDSFKPLEITNLAKECGMSESNLRLQFKNIFDITIYKFQQKQRMIHAKEMLKQKDKSVSQVSIELGFSTMSHFAATFKKEYGITPKQFQKELLKR